MLNLSSKRGDEEVEVKAERKGTPMRPRKSHDCEAGEVEAPGMVVGGRRDCNKTCLRRLEFH